MNTFGLKTFMTAMNLRDHKYHNSRSIAKIILKIDDLDIQIRHHPSIPSSREYPRYVTIDIPQTCSYEKQTVRSSFEKMSHQSYDPQLLLTFTHICYMIKYVL